RIELQRAPLWLTKARRPSIAKRGAKVAFRPRLGIITPRQFGPTIRIWPRRAMIASSSFAPKGPDSLKPAEIIIAPVTPDSAHSWTTSGTVAAGVAIIAKSTLLRTAPIFGKAGRPRTVFRLRFTG